jgi:hypothetical protein
MHDVKIRSPNRVTERVKRNTFDIALTRLFFLT